MSLESRLGWEDEEGRSGDSFLPEVSGCHRFQEVCHRAGWLCDILHWDTWAQELVGVVSHRRTQRQRGFQAGCHRTHQVCDKPPHAVAQRPVTIGSDVRLV